MSRTCIGYEMIVSVRPYLGYGIDLRSSVRHVWDMHWLRDDSQCKTMSGTWHRLEIRVLECLGRVSHTGHQNDHVEMGVTNALASAEGTAPVESEPVTVGQGGEARKAYFRMMDAWYTEFVRANPNTPPPSPPLIPQYASTNLNDDSEKAEFWLENTISVFDELSCTSEECVKYTVSVLRDSAYQWWNTLMFVVPRERITWEFFQEEFRKKYISQRFIDQKRKKFLELKQGQMSVTEYECEFVRLKLREFVVLVERACKAEELVKERRKVAIESRDSKRRQMGKSHQSSSKRSKEFAT
ncbi:Maturase K [Gossypium arboreum]|uniref:Maturase K n=1 Tax=Gossypium arboreum TaxID=29729 RepID=A0A0B0N6N9_GOSAR|nr:Maturase K [Gossypium arboreum]